jgi:hypothetical protein
MARGAQVLQSKRPKTTKMEGRGTWVLQSKRLKLIIIEGKWVQNLQWKRMETMTNTHLTRIGFCKEEYEKHNEHLRIQILQGRGQTPTQEESRSIKQEDEDHNEFP